MFYVPLKFLEEIQYPLRVYSLILQPVNPVFYLDDFSS